MLTVVSGCDWLGIRARQRLAWRHGRLSAVAIVRSWHDAMNTRDADRLVELAAEDVEVGGPRGSGRGRQLLRDWVGRQLEGAAGHFEPRRYFGHGNTAVVEQRAEWRSVETGEPVGEPVEFGSVFAVDGGRVTRFAR
jgi:ketosteroid isomerase-like protein